MSFRKVTRSVHGPGKRPGRQRKLPRPKQDWVSTIHDLTVHQATPEELSRRHELHRSRHQVAAQWDLRQRELKSSGVGQASSPEVSSEQYRLQDVLARSDHIMAMVKDIFGDAPPRRTGFPSVTVAQDHRLALEPMLPLDPSRPGGCGPEQSPGDAAESRGPVQDRCHSQPLSTDALGGSPSCPQSPMVPQGSQCALNATPVVKQLHKVGPSASLVSRELNLEPTSPQPVKRTNRGQRADFSRLSSSDLHPLSGGCSSLEVLQARLRKLELQLDSLDPAAVPRTSRHQQGDATLGGFSTALVAILGRLVEHLCQSHEEVQEVLTERRSLEEQLGEQQQLIDALTAESLLLCQDNAALQKHVKGLDQRLDALVLAMGELGGLEPVAEPRAAARVRHSCADTCTDAHRLHLSADSASCALSPERDVREEQSPFPAVLLSPPRQTDSRPPLTRVARGKLVTSSREHQETEYEESTASSWSFVSRPCHGPAHSPSSKLDPVLQQNLLIPAPSDAGGTALHLAQKGVPSVEQRLLELNRSSVEARSRLLSLIEEQRQAFCSGVSPCISPIPSASPPRASALLPGCDPDP